MPERKSLGRMVKIIIIRLLGHAPKGLLIPILEDSG
jgi:hypothetical protein